jgi:hypothetical protein
MHTHLGFRDMVPALLLRVTQDHIAFDFIRWYALYPDGNYQWGNARLPFLHYWQCDIAEDVFQPGNTIQSYSLNHIGIYALIKVRLYLHLVNVEAMYTLLLAIKTATQQGEHEAVDETAVPLSKLGGQLDIVRLIKSFLLEASNKRFGICELAKEKAALFAQIAGVIAKGESMNNRIWKALVNPRPLMSQRPPRAYGLKSPEECYFAIGTCLPAWRAHTDAYAFLTSYITLHGGIKYDATMRGF